MDSAPGKPDERRRGDTGKGDKGQDVDGMDGRQRDSGRRGGSRGELSFGNERYGERGNQLPEGRNGYGSRGKLPFRNPREVNGKEQNIPPLGGGGGDHIGNANPMMEGRGREEKLAAYHQVKLDRLGGRGRYAGPGRIPQLPQAPGNQDGNPNMNDVLRWVLETCAERLEEATGSLKIRAIPDFFPQLVVTRPTPELQNAFAAKRGQRILMFHGTPLPNLRSILHDGFNTALVWAAGEPGYSLMFAKKGQRFGGLGGGMGMGMGMERGRAGLFAPFGNQVQTPYDTYGVLFGCEVAKEYITRGGFALGISSAKGATPDPRAVMVRYVFLIPPNTSIGTFIIMRIRDPGQDGPSFPERRVVERQMTENIREINARIEGMSRSRAK